MYGGVRGDGEGELGEAEEGEVLRILREEGGETELEES